MTDFISTDPAVTPEVPAKPAIQYPMNWMDRLSVSTPSPSLEGRLEAHFVPYRKIYAEDGVTVLGSELQCPPDPAKVRSIVSETLFASCQVTPEQGAAVVAAVAAAAQGGYLRALAMAALMESINEEGIAQGVFTAPNQEVPV